ncbi:MAG: tetraacyldisaccharide 4'-kinase [Deltaproteobacteria bacterium]|nr:tetraacyldisaccharide 4'-kinase [Deltaproteobacteria bacterium]MBW1960484.1 tetraacyldisaccharide 4'-kinase [Deltaproteobacteria bacterium]MBW2154203.1 tetraacyldisaccharide 4'-kinase [Deltaproteobacteria bacterium]
MSAFGRKMQTTIRQEQNQSVSSLKMLLLFSSMLYGAAVRMRTYLYEKGLFRSKSLPCKIVSIGNITTGGTGKTPMSIYVAKAIFNMGYKVAVVSRGYKGSAEKTGGIVSDGQAIQMSPYQAGDEPYLMAHKLKGIPILVGRNRFQSAKRAVEEFGVDVVVLDDAFQHLALKRDIDLLLIDHAHPFGNNHLLPRGLLREPLSALSRADAFILTRTDRPGTGGLDLLQKTPTVVPVFKSFHSHYHYDIQEEGLKNGIFPSNHLQPNRGKLVEAKQVFAFSGIAVNEDFRRTLCSLGCHVVGYLEFPDHHPYSEKDLRSILNLSEKTGAKVLVTTEKDYVRIAPEFFITRRTKLVVVGIETTFGPDTKGFLEFLRSRLEAV